MLKTKQSSRKINKILFCAAEATPLAKVGGLADVVGSLPKAMRSQGVDVRVLLPAYSTISLSKLAAKKIISFSLLVDGKKEAVTIYEAKVQGTVFYLLQNKKYFKGEVYDGDNARKYLFFSRAALLALPLLPFKPSIIHAHDFHAAPIISELSLQDRNKRPGLVLTIHNLQHQGWVKTRTAAAFGFKIDEFPQAAFNHQKGDWLNLLAAGIATADKITTVSPNYAQEILTPTYGHRLEELLRSRRQDLSGIINGIDVESYNSTTDVNLAQTYSSADMISGKDVNKKAVRTYLNLENNATPLFVFVARFSEQKGLDLFDGNALWNLNRTYPFQLVLLGSGEEKYESLALNLSRSMRENIRTLITFDEVLARNLYAAADYFLIPSLFEPCGLTQMIAMRYGAVPLVRATGGLKDTVKDRETGLVFKDYSASSFISTFEKALRLYYKKNKKYQNMRQQGGRKDWSWTASAPTYKRLYDSI